MSKKWFAVLLIVMMMVSLAACGSEPAAEDGKPSGDSGTTTEAAAEEAAPVMFATEDLSLEPITSEQIFADNKITMINVWATFCGYCIEEMPDLEILKSRLEEKDCGIIGVVGDIEGVQDKQHLQDALEIVESTGVTYPNLLPWDNFEYMLPVPGYPTTFFVDSEGNLIGEPAVGARGAKDYEALVDEALAAIGE